MEGSRVSGKTNSQFRWIRNHEQRKKNFPSFNEMKITEIQVELLKEKFDKNFY